MFSQTQSESLETLMYKVLITERNIFFDEFYDFMNSIQAITEPTTETTEFELLCSTLKKDKPSRDQRD